MSPTADAQEVSNAIGIHSPAGNHRSVIRTGDVVVDLERRIVRADGKPVRLTGREYSILELLSLRPGSSADVRVEPISVPRIDAVFAAEELGKLGLVLQPPASAISLAIDCTVAGRQLNASRLRSKFLQRTGKPFRARGGNSRIRGFGSWYCCPAALLDDRPSVPRRCLVKLRQFRRCVGLMPKPLSRHRTSLRFRITSRAGSAARSDV